MYSSWGSPLESPEPRNSTRSDAYPCPANHGCISASLGAVKSRCLKGAYSTRAGTGLAFAVSGIQTRACSQQPSASGILMLGRTSTSCGKSVRACERSTGAAIRFTTSIYYCGLRASTHVRVEVGKRCCSAERGYHFIAEQFQRAFLFFMSESQAGVINEIVNTCLLYTSPSPRD